MSGVSGKYRLDQRLGGGGMAEVFLASSLGAEGFSRKVAIKRVLPGYSDNDAFAKMFIAEARISSQLVHPNIVSVLDFDRDDDKRLFLVMELVEGKDLDALVSTGLLPFGVVVFVIGEVLRGLGYAHDLPVGNESRGVVHRDISPHNVLLSWAGAVKVSDFGIAKARAASEATASVFIKGKPAYMSPEQANGQPLDGRSDLFAIGIMLWEMLVGRRLFTGEDTRSTLAAVLFGQIPRPRALRPEIPKDLERVVMKLLDRDLPSRYATAEHALHDLLECADAPRAGREALTAVLGERFAAEAPVRQSLMRARSAQASAGPDAWTTPLPASPVHVRPAAALPSLGAMMNAPTGTIDERPGRSRLGKILLVLGVTLGSAALTFAIVTAVKHKGSGLAGSDAANPVSPLSNEPGRDSAVPDDGRAQIPDAALVVDTMLADAATSAPKAANPTPVIEKRYGSLVVSTDPIVTIYVDGKLYNDSPRTIRLLVGRHAVHLVNADAHVDLNRSATILENKVTTIDWQKPKTP